MAEVFIRRHEQRLKNQRRRNLPSAQETSLHPVNDSQVVYFWDIPKSVYDPKIGPREIVPITTTPNESLQSLPPKAEVFVA
jgi:hypothetical protein